MLSKWNVRISCVLAIYLGVLFFSSCGQIRAAENLCLEEGTLSGWAVEGESVWQVVTAENWHSPFPEGVTHIVHSLGKGEGGTGKLKSGVFEITAETQRFYIGGADGTEKDLNDGDRNFVLLRSYPGGEILRKMRTPNAHFSLQKVSWMTGDLIGRKVYLEVVDGNPGLNKGGFAWIAFAGYAQQNREVPEPVVQRNLSGLKIDGNADFVMCRTLPFWAVGKGERGETKRVVEGGMEIIPVNARAKTVYLLGMINEGWDCGVAHWGEHMELREERNDQVYVGSWVGEMEIEYADGSCDEIPLQVGATIWFHAFFAYGPSHLVNEKIREPFASRPDMAKVFHRSLKLKEEAEPGSQQNYFKYYYLPLHPRDKEIRHIVVRDNPELRGRPLVSGITLETEDQGDHLKPFGKWRANADDLAARIDTSKRIDFSQDIKALSRALYTREEDLPTEFDLLEFPEHMDAARVRFRGGRWADMLWNIWVQNLITLDEKFESDTGFFYESGVDYPWYGGYSGIGVWGPLGIYRGTAFGRCSDHFATFTMRCLHDAERWENYVDFCDRHLYFYRNDHDPCNGPPNMALDIDKYPKDAPPHWGFGVNGPCPAFAINELQFDEETDGHGATVVGRWYAWRLLGAPADEWLTSPREEVYGKSRWDSTRDSTEFICWLMDHTARDVMWCEGETTGWAAAQWKDGRVVGFMMTPAGWAEETDIPKIRKNYANCNHMYQPYPTYVCRTALLCSAQIADAVGEKERAQKWRAYAKRLEEGMMRELFVGDHSTQMWRISPYSVYPSFQDSLVQAWFSLYIDGLDPKRWDEKMTNITIRTLDRQLNQEYGHAPVLAMGYGIGWLMHSALVLDHMDDAGKLLVNFTRYMYDKNMDYVDESRGIDWRRWLWLIPEGTNVLPDGSWYRIGDLTNGANQGPPLHAIEMCAGIDDANPKDLRIMPRVPDPMTGVEVSNFAALVPDGDGLKVARVEYTYDKEANHFILKSDTRLPKLSVRVGPYTRKAAEAFAKRLSRPAGAKVRVEQSGTYQEKNAWWVWVENMRGVSQVTIQ